MDTIISLYGTVAQATASSLCSDPRYREEIGGAGVVTVLLTSGRTDSRNYRPRYIVGK